jgi:hypothetical protein
MFLFTVWGGVIFLWWIIWCLLGVCVIYVYSLGCIQSENITLYHGKSIMQRGVWGEERGGGYVILSITSGRLQDYGWGPSVVGTSCKATVYRDNFNPMLSSPITFKYRLEFVGVFKFNSEFSFGLKWNIYHYFVLRHSDFAKLLSPPGVSHHGTKWKISFIHFKVIIFLKFHIRQVLLCKHLYTVLHVCNIPLAVENM